MAWQPITGNNASFGGGPIQTFDFRTGGPPVKEFVPTGAGGSNNGRGVEVMNGRVFYTELSGGFGPSESIHVAPFNGGAGGADVFTIPNPRPGTGIQDLAQSGGSLYAMAGYPFSEPLQVFKLKPANGKILAGPISIGGPAGTTSDGFTVLPNGNFLINSSDGNCEYNQYDGSTGTVVPSTTIIVPGGTFCTGVDNNGTSLFFQTNFNSFTQTDMAGSLIVTKPVSGENEGIEDISVRP